MKDYSGEYYLEGIMETASAFKINADHTFEFFFVYGALDRSAAGTWKEITDSVIELSSTPPARPSFSIKSETTTSGKNIEFVVDKLQQPLLRYTQITVVPGDGNAVEADGDGRFLFPAGPVEKFTITCYLYGDNPAELTPANASSNRFILQIDPSIILVQFKGLKLRLDGNVLEGRVPEILDPERSFRFVK